MVHRLVELGGGEPLLGGEDAAGHQGLVQQRVDLVEGQPGRHAVAVPLEEDPEVALVAVDQLAAGPAVMGAGQVERGLVVADGDQRFDAVLLELVEDPVVERQPGFVGVASSPCGKIRLQAIENRKTVNPISAKRAMSSA